MPTPLRLLDCTLRDGGYYNSWDFDPALVQDYLQAISAAGVEFVEIGFRGFAQKKYLGPYAYSTEDHLATLDIPAGLKLAAMVNADELLSRKEPLEDSVDQLFAPRSASALTLVRIAVHFSQLDRSRGIAARLKQLGYMVGLNLMQAGGKPSANISAAAQAVTSWGCVDVFYFADSLGNMMPEDIASTFSAIRKGWPGPIGLHAHNNMGQALFNSCRAIDEGATWIDGTVLGMGRGAGNVPMESLLLELRRRKTHQSDADPLFALVLGRFHKMQLEYQWGPSVLYFLSALHNIHPTYVQTMLEKTQYHPRSLIAAIESLKDADTSAFNSAQLESALSGGGEAAAGSWSASNWAKDRTVLMLAGGPSMKIHREALQRFISKTRPLVLSLNVNPTIADAYIDAYVTCHKVSLLMDAQTYMRLKKPLVAPRGAIPKTVLDHLRGVEILDYGMNVKRDTFKPSDSSCTIPSVFSAAYAMALAEASGAKEILLAGFDGYASSDPRQREMNHILRCYQSRPEALPIKAITPSTYEMTHGSVYAPTL